MGPFMVRLIALLAAILLMAVVSYLGYEAWIFGRLDADTLHDAASALNMNLGTYASTVGPMEVTRALLAIAAMIPVPTLLRIAADKGG